MGYITNQFKSIIADVINNYATQKAIESKDIQLCFQINAKNENVKYRIYNEYKTFEEVEYGDIVDSVKNMFLKGFAESMEDSAKSYFKNTLLQLIDELEVDCKSVKLFAVLYGGTKRENLKLLLFRDGNYVREVKFSELEG